jgi:hypothetical protein
VVFGASAGLARPVAQSKAKYVDALPVKERSMSTEVVSFPQASCSSQPVQPDTPSCPDATALEAVDLVQVPRRATKEMIEAAYWSNLDDDIEGIWEAMVDCWLRCQQGEFR